MKKYYFLFTVMLMALVSVGLASCGDDDEPKGSDIVGTWQLKDADGETLLQFTKDGKFNEVDIVVEEGVADLYVEHGTYSLSGDKLTITYVYSFEIETVECRYSVNGDKLTITALYASGIFTRVDDSVIERYL